VFAFVLWLYINHGRETLRQGQGRCCGRYVDTLHRRIVWAGRCHVLAALSCYRLSHRDNTFAIWTAEQHLPGHQYCSGRKASVSVDMVDISSMWQARCWR